MKNLMPHRNADGKIVGPFPAEDDTPLNPDERVRLIGADAADYDLEDGGPVGRVVRRREVDAMLAPARAAAAESAEIQALVDDKNSAYWRGEKEAVRRVADHLLAQQDSTDE